MRQMEIITYRVQNALNCQTLHERCVELTRIINESNSKELQGAFVSILDAIFSVPGWFLRTLDRTTNVVDVEAILRFLDPLGPLFTLAYKLTSDYFLKYELSLSCLPARLRRDLESGINIPALYSEKLQIDPQTRRPISLLLSPFELLIFRYVLLMTQNQQPEVWTDSVYLLLTERYLCHFLPCDLQAGPVQPHVPFMPQAHQGSPAPHSYSQNSPSKQGAPTSLLKASIAMNFSQSTPPSGSPTHQSPLVEIWRTVLLTQVLVDVWLCVDDDLKPGVAGTTLRTSLTSGVSSTITTAEHAKMVRCLIKHMHYFANSACYTNPTSMDEMKRMILPSSKLKIYRYFTYTMSHWPLDTSFRILLEGWLSFIQPWRYTNYLNYLKLENDESGKPVDRRWEIFIAEHLPFYTYIFKQLITRFQRLDLSSLKNAIMMYRLIRVFSLENFWPMIQEVEASISLRPGSHISNSSLPCNNTQAQMELQNQLKWQNAALQAHAELEGQDTIYERLFGPQMQTVIQNFILETVYSAKIRAEQLAQDQQARHKIPGFWSSFFGPSESDLEEYTLEDRKRVPQLLQTCVDQFIVLFQITNLPDLSTSFCQSETSNASLGLNTSFFNNASFLGPSGRPIEFEGHPDLRLISSHEFVIFVRMFHELSSWINQQYGEDIQLLHAGNGFLSKLARQVLQPPCTYYTCEKDSKMGYKVRTPKHLPARLRLRGLANQWLLLKVLSAGLILWMWGFSLYGSIVALVFIYFVKILIQALME